MLDTITEFIVKYLGSPYIISNIYLLVGIGIVFTVYESIWRRWFGGGYDFPKWINWLNRRFVRHVVNIIALFSVCYWVRGLAWYWSLYFTLVLQILFWTLTFGMYFDIGRAGKPPTEYDISEYNKSWMAPILNWIFPEESRYTPYYDFCGMLIRFTGPCLLLFWVPTFNSGYILLGLWVAMVYGLCWVMYDKSIIKKLGPTELAEYLSGAFVGWMTIVCGMI